MENNAQGSPSHNCPNTPDNPSSPSDDEMYDSTSNTNVMNNTSASNDVDNVEEVIVTSYINILTRDPMPSPPIGAPPAPEFSPTARARILQLLAVEKVEGNHEDILEGVARTIADLYPHLINDENAIILPQTGQISLNHYNEEIFNNASAEENWDHADIPIDIVDDETGESIFYDPTSEEENGDDPEATNIDILTDNNMTLEELWELEAVYGLPEFVIARQLKSEEYKCLTSNPQHEETCRVCLDSYKDGDKTAKLECGDMFHYDCISLWLTSKNVCPLCRRTGLYP